jgi:hypothetical protein
MGGADLVDWLRAKLLFIVAFLCLDAFLAWEVSRLTVPLLDLGAPHSSPVLAPAPLGRGQGVFVMGTLQAPEAPPQRSAPPLEVETVGVDRRALSLLPTPYTCTAPGPLGPRYASDCTAKGGTELRQLGGALVYTAPRARAAVTQTPQLLANAIVRQVDPVNALFAGAQSASDGTTLLRYLETYDGVVLFDGGWTVRVGSRLITATRFWLRVLARRAPLPVISATQAVAAAAAALGTGVAHPLVVSGPVLFGYYFPIRYPPATVVGPSPVPLPKVWQLVPVWRVHVAQPTQGCIFINAYSGQPEEALSATPLVTDC